MNLITKLPIRSTKRVVEIPAVVPQTSARDADILAAMKCFNQQVSITLPGRGVDVHGKPDPTRSATFHFLINPSRVSVSEQTLDQQTFTRAGWQNGVWGSGIVSIGIMGTTPGKYFHGGLTDVYSEYSASYRNALELEMVYENNGYFFEGEEAGSGPLAAAATRKQLKAHEDVCLSVQDFVWYGMFESMRLEDDAESPYQSNFDLRFLAWKQRYKANSTGLNAITNSSRQGHYPVHKHVERVTVSITDASGNLINPAQSTSTVIMNPKGWGSE